MGALITVLIILGILLLLALPFLVLLRFRFTANEEEGAVLSLHIGPLRFPVYPTPPKKIKRRHYTKRAIEKRRKKEEEKAAERAKKEAEKKAQKEKEKQESKKKKIHIRSALSLARFALRTIELFLRKFGGHLRIVIRELQIVIATEDAAKTAILYGAVCPTADAILRFADTHFRQVRIAHSAPVSCNADFLSEKSQVRICIDFCIRPWQLLDSVFLVVRRAVGNRRVRRLLIKRSL